MSVVNYQTRPDRTEPLQVSFEGIAGESHTGDIAIDDVSLIQGACTIS